MKNILACLLMLLLAVVVSSCATNSTVGTEDGADERTNQVKSSSSAGDDNPDEKGQIESGAPAPTDQAPGSDDGDSKKADSGEKIESIYTSLEEKNCKLVEGSQDIVSAEEECPGIADYKLILGDYDARQTIHVVFPDGKKHDLKFNKIVSSAFSEVGDKAEWRVIRKNGKVVPIALIVRFNVSIAAARPENPPPDVSFLTVSKISEDLTCVTDAVKPTKDQNMKARRLADSASARPCRTEEVNMEDFIDSL